MLEQAQTIVDQAEQAIGAATSPSELEEIRVRFLGRKAELPQMLRSVSELPAEERGAVGKKLNEHRRVLEGLVAARRTDLEAGELDSRLADDRVDVTLPGDPAVPLGRVHLLTATRREIEDVFLGL